MDKPHGEPIPPSGIAGEMNFIDRAVLMWARGTLWDYLGLIVIPACVFFAIVFEKSPLLVDVPVEARMSLFQTLATVSGTMAGLIFTSISIMVNLVRTPLSALDRLTRPEDKRKVGDVFIAVLPKLVLTFIFALSAIAVEASLGRGVIWIQGLLFVSAISSISGLGRVVWVLRRLLKLSNA